LEITNNKIPATNNDNFSAGKNGNMQLDKMAFLKLLTQQLKSQDPLNPMDSTQFMSQLAELSMVEQTTNMAESMKNVEQLLTGLSAAVTMSASWQTAINMINKTVKFKDNSEALIVSVLKKDNGIVLKDEKGNEYELGNVVEVMQTR